MDHIRETRQDRILNVFINVVLLIAAILVIYPLVYVVSASFSSPSAIISGKVILWPVEPTLDGYKAVFGTAKIWRGYMNTIYYAVLGTIIGVVMTILAAYPLSRKDLLGRRVIMMLMTFTMIFSGGMIPTYLVVRNLGLLNTRWAMLIPSAMTVWNVIIAKTYFENSIPDELLEAAQLDGCGNTRFILSIVLPLSRPILAITALYYGVAQWNAFFNALLYLRDETLYPLQMVLREILLQNQSSDMMANIESQELKAQLEALLKYGTIVVSTVPMLCVYPFVQKHFVKGMLVGSVKA